MRGVNTGAWSGNVGSRIYFGRTETSDEDACSFDLAVEGKGGPPVWIRVNVYGPGLVSICRERLAQGVYVQVAGALMNRRSRTEVRAEQVIFGGSPDQKKEVESLRDP